jgi:H+/Cl- antiporter ClcA
VAAEGSSTHGRIREPAYLKTLLLAALLGVPAAFAAVLFTSAVHAAEVALWTDLPEQFGWVEPAWWYVLLLPAVGGALVAATLRLPGKGGHPASDGLGLHPTTPLELPSVLLAAGASLAFGLVLGPEAPLLALGLTLGAVAARLARSGEGHAQDLVFAGGFAAIAAILGGPIVSAFMLFELVAASGTVPAQAIGHLLLPGFLASGTGYLIFVGVGDWKGLDVPQLAVSGLPDYTSVRLADLGWSVPLAAAVAVVVVSVRRFGRALGPRAARRPDVVLVVGGAAVGALAVLFRAFTDRPADLVLFSGQTSLPAIVAEGSAGVLGALVLTKALAYGISVGAGFRGGVIFPAVTLGVMSGALAAVVLPGFDLTPAVMAGIAAGAAASLTLPFFGALLAAILGGAAGADAIPIAIVAAAVAWLVTLELDHPRRGGGRAATSDPPEAASPSP